MTYFLKQSDWSILYNIAPSDFFLTSPPDKHLQLNLAVSTNFYEMELNTDLAQYLQRRQSLYFDILNITGSPKCDVFLRGVQIVSVSLSAGQYKFYIDNMEYGYLGFQWWHDGTMQKNIRLHNTMIYYNTGNIKLKFSGPGTITVDNIIISNDPPPVPFETLYPLVLDFDHET